MQVNEPRNIKPKRNILTLNGLQQEVLHQKSVLWFNCKSQALPGGHQIIFQINSTPQTNSAVQRDATIDFICNDCTKIDSSLKLPSFLPRVFLGPDPTKKILAENLTLSWN